MLKIGLTGGIGSGKSAAAKYFADLGVPVIDADVIARDLVKVGLPAYKAIVEIFGANVLSPNGELDRGKLREIVFSDAEQRVRLENILHPLIRLKVNRAISRADGAYCLVVIPLMIETGQTDIVDRLIVVDVPIALQVKRTIQRDGMEPGDVEAIIRTQVDGPTRRAAADFIIENTGSLELLKEKVLQLHTKFLQPENTLVDNQFIEDNVSNSDDIHKTNTQVMSDMPLLEIAEETLNDEPRTEYGTEENIETESAVEDKVSENNSVIELNPSETVYELPFNEKVRAFVRLESLFNEIEFKLQGTSVWDSRSTIQSLMALLDVFGRPEIKTDLMKEMDRMNNVLTKYESMSGVNTGRLQDVKDELCQMAKNLRSFEGQIGQNLKLNELIMAIRQRDSLPGGALGIDVPSYAYWLAQDIEVRNADIRSWLKEFDLIKRSVNLILRLIRESAIESQVKATKGVYQHVLEAGATAQIVCVVLPENAEYFPEISGGRHRFTVRFLKPMGVMERPVQVEQDIPFKIVCCAL